MTTEVNFEALIDAFAEMFAQKIALRVKEKTYVELQGLLKSLENIPETSPKQETSYEGLQLNVKAFLGDTDKEISAQPKIESVSNPSPEIAQEITATVPTCVITTNADDSKTEQEEKEKSDAKQDKDAALKAGEFIEKVNLDILPMHLKEAALTLSKHDLMGFKLVLWTIHPDEWVASIMGELDVDVGDLFGGHGFSERYIAISNAHFKKTSARVVKQAYKILRAKEANANSLKKLEENKRKREALAQKQREKKAAEEVRKKSLEAASNVKPKEYYSPVIDKMFRKKVGIVGILSAQQSLIQEEFGETFIFTMAEGRDGIAKIKQIMECPDKKLFVMGDFVSHSHTELLDRDKMTIVRGGMTHLREALSNYAKQGYK